MKFRQLLARLSAVGGIGLTGYWGYWRYTEKSHQFNAWTTAEQAIDNMDLSKKTAIVTGCNVGIGKETVRVLVQQGCNVVMACRTPKSAEIAREEILQDLNLPSDYQKLSVMQLDLASLDNIKQFADDFNSTNTKVDYLINNAGVMAIPYHVNTHDGFEMQFGTNHLGHFYLTNQLLPSLQRKSDSNASNASNASKASGCRVINLSSRGEGYFTDDEFKMGHLFDQCAIEKEFMGPLIQQYHPWINYGISKTCNVLFSRKLSQLYGDEGIVSVSVHPGAITSTGLTRHAMTDSKTQKQGLIPFTQGRVTIKGLLFEDIKNVEQGAATTLRCVSMDDDEITPGGYYFNCRLKNEDLRGVASKDANGEMAEKLWELSKILIESRGHSLN